MLKSALRLAYRFLMLAALTGFVIAVQPTTSLAADNVIDWVKQFGSTRIDHGMGTAVDTSGNVYVVGETFGALPGASSSGISDAYVRKYDSSGTVLWTRQFGSALRNAATGVTTDSFGHAYVVGGTEGALPGGGGSSGGGDAFIRKYSPSGSILWTRQFGTSGYDSATDATTDTAGNVYVVGDTGGAFSDGGGWLGEMDAFVTKYDASGNIIWTRQFGTATLDFAAGSATDAAGNVYVAGDTDGALPGGGGSQGSTDTYVRKYDTSGNILWTNQFGSPAHDFSEGAATDSAGNVYVVGCTDGALPGGGGSRGDADAYVRKYDPSGNIIWTRQFGSAGFGSAGDDCSRGTATDSIGNVYVVGHTDGALPATDFQAFLDAFIRKYDSSGNIAWTRQFGSASSDYALSAAAGSGGDVYVLGHTDGALPGGGGSQGGTDAYVMKFRVGLAAYYVTPNPFSPNFDGVEDTQGFVFTLTKSAHVVIRVSNYKGVVKTVYGGPYIKNGVLYNEYLGPGPHAVGWTGTDDTGRVLPAGNYGYEIIARNGTETGSVTGITSVTPVSLVSK